MSIVSTSAPATIAPSEPSASESTCASAARVFALCVPERRMSAASEVHAEARAPP
jgi:hypothetical protein